MVDTEQLATADDTTPTGGRSTASTTPERNAREPRADARANRERILDAARQAFAEHGISAEVKDIAERADVGIGTIYRNFPTRDDLLAEVVEDARNELIATLERAQTLDDPVVGLRQAVHDLYRLIPNFGWLADALLSGQLPPRVREQIHARHDADKERDHFAQMIERAIANGSFRADINPSTVSAFLAGTLTPWTLQRIVGDREIPTVVDAVFDLLLNGVANPQPPTE